MNGFGSDNSDVDMCLLVRHTEMDQRNEAIGHLEQILKCLKRCGVLIEIYYNFCTKSGLTLYQFELTRSRFFFFLCKQIL